jgi:hypothetical protein
MGHIFALVIPAALNPALFAAITIILTLDQPKRLLAGLWAGAAFMSIGVGMIVVLALNGSSSTTNTAGSTLSPIVDIALGLMVLIACFIVGTGRDKRRRERAARKKQANADKAPPKWKTMLNEGTPRTTFAVGLFVNLPCPTYITALALTDKQNLSTGGDILTVLAFVALLLLPVEIPLLGYVFAPTKTKSAVEAFITRLERDGGKWLLWGSVFLGVAMVARGAINALAS